MIGKVWISNYYLADGGVLRFADCTAALSSRKVHCPSRALKTRDLKVSSTLSVTCCLPVAVIITGQADSATRHLQSTFKAMGLTASLYQPRSSSSSLLMTSITGLSEEKKLMSGEEHNHMVSECEGECGEVLPSGHTGYRQNTLDRNYEW